jgi:DNA-directed RNA polymerase subunit RPC12/RpoP
MRNKDKIIKCVDCAQEFAWTVGEQEFYKEKGLREPVRCPMCRAAFKAAQKDQFRGKIKTVSN